MGMPAVIQLSRHSVVDDKVIEGLTVFHRLIHSLKEKTSLGIETLKSSD